MQNFLLEVNTATRTRPVVLQLPTAAATLSLQQIARLKVTQTIDIDGYWLPIIALIRGNRGLWSSYGLVRSEDSQHFQAERRYIELLETQGDRVLVKGTLQPGDEIIIDGTHRIIPSQLVKKVSAKGLSFVRK